MSIIEFKPSRCNPPEVKAKIIDPQTYLDPTRAIIYLPGLFTEPSDASLRPFVQELADVNMSRVYALSAEKPTPQETGDKIAQFFQKLEEYPFIEDLIIVGYSRGAIDAEFLSKLLPNTKGIIAINRPYEQQLSEVVANATNDTSKTITNAARNPRTIIRTARYVIDLIPGVAREISQGTMLKRIKGCIGPDETEKLEIPIVTIGGNDDSISRIKGRYSASPLRRPLVGKGTHDLLYMRSTTVARAGLYSLYRMGCKPPRYTQPA